MYALTPRECYYQSLEICNIVMLEKSTFVPPLNISIDGTLSYTAYNTMTHAKHALTFDDTNGLLPFLIALSGETIYYKNCLLYVFNGLQLSYRRIFMYINDSNKDSNLGNIWMYFNCYTPFIMWFYYYYDKNNGYKFNKNRLSIRFFVTEISYIIIYIKIHYLIINFRY